MSIHSLPCGLLFLLAALVLIVPDPRLSHAHHPPTAPLPVPVSVPTTALVPYAAARCDSNDRPPKTTFRIEYCDEEVDVPTFKVREVPFTEPKHRLELKPQVEQMHRQTLELQPREVIKEVTVHTHKLVCTTDPVTGCKTHRLVPVVEVQQIKEIRYMLCPKQTTEAVQRFCIEKRVDEVQYNRFELDHTVEKKAQRKPVLIPTITHERTLNPGPVCCPPEHPAERSTPADTSAEPNTPAPR